LDKAVFDREVTAWLGVTIEKKQWDVSYTMLAIVQQFSPVQTLDVGTNSTKKEQMPSRLEEWEDEGEEEALLWRTF